MKLGNYEWNPETDWIAQGAFAEVFRARDIHADRLVAIKIYKESVSKGTSVSTGEKKYTLEREFRNISSLSHTNIISYYGLDYIQHEDMMGRKSNYPLIVMEYATEGTLSDFMKTGPSEPALLKIMEDIFQGVGYLHSEGVLHRDLKPGNILITKNRKGEPVAKIVDFGISRDTLTNKTIEQSFTEGIGTPHYMSPEQFYKKKFGLQSELSERTDIWAIGVIIYWMFTGRLPFGDGSKDYELIREEIIEKEPDFSQVPEKYRSLIANCLAKHAEERVDSIYALLKGLKNPDDESARVTITRTEPTYHRSEAETIHTPTAVIHQSSEPPVIAQPVELKKSKSRALLWIAAAVLVIGSGIGFFIYNQHLDEQIQLAMDKAGGFMEMTQYDSALHYYDQALTFRKIDSIVMQKERLNILMAGLSDFYGARYESSVTQLKKAAHMHSGDAYYYLGELAYNGLGMKEDDSLGVSYTNKAVEYGFEMAYWRQASNYKDGTGGSPVDPDKSDELFMKVAEVLTRLAEAGNAEAQGNLGFMYSTGKVYPQNDNLAMKWYARAAEQGYAFVQVNLAQAYYAKGQYGSAYHWYDKAASVNEPRGLHGLGTMYAFGDSIPKDWLKAKSWLEKAADLQYQASSNMLGQLYYIGGNGIDKNYSTALSWFERAGDEYLTSLINRGEIYAIGDKTVARNYAKAVEFLEKSLVIEERQSTLETLGLIYQTGDQYLPKNINKAIAYHKKAGSGESAYQLFNIYLDKKDSKTAVEWLAIGIKKGHAKSIEMGAALLASTTYYYKNEFNKEDNFFAAGGDSDYKMGVSSGKFVIEGLNPDYNYTRVSAHSEIDETKDYTISVDAKYLKSKESSNAFGLVFGRKDAKNYNYALISSFGSFKFISVRDGKTTTSTEWLSNKSKSGVVSNNIKISREGVYFVVYINGTYIGKYQQPSDYGNVFGVVVLGASKVEFDNFMLTGSKK